MRRGYYRITPEREAAIIETYQAVGSIKITSERTGSSMSVVHRVLGRNNIEKNPVGNPSRRYASAAEVST